jgi:hypothetical protein
MFRPIQTGKSTLLNSPPGTGQAADELLGDCFVAPNPFDWLEFKHAS